MWNKEIIPLGIKKLSHVKYILYLCTDIRCRSLGIRRRTAYVSEGEQPMYPEALSRLLYPFIH